ncbi:hypothetical protein AALO_G00067810 [Alosa alosa]|uniref:Uncharacterized protein n=1 Tax=Alosa alosa TaxID=278164 RepID=A0AAV6H5R4_9TELE|nr:hypothetical protein AALO_G00067810 [Alosa alosa]
MGDPRMGGPRMGGPRMGGPRMGDPRMGGPRMGGPQKAPEPAPFSGFMSMFSGPSTPSRPAAPAAPTSGFFSVPQTSFFKSAPTPAAGAPPPQKSSFFNLPTSLPTDSLTGDLFGMFKAPDSPKATATKPASPEPTDKTDEEKPGPDGQVTEAPEASSTTEDSKAEVFDSNKIASEEGEAESAKDAGPEIPNKDDSTLSERPASEEQESAQRQDSVSAEADITPGATSTEGEGAPQDSTKIADVESKPPPEIEPSSPKGMFDIPGLSTPSFGFMSGVTDTAKPFGSLFSTSPAPAAKPQEPQPESGGLFSGFKGLSAGLFQEEKPTDKKEESAPSMFGMKIGFPFSAASETPKPQTPPPVTTQPKAKEVTFAEDGKPPGEPAAHRMASVDSDITGSADASDTEGPTDSSDMIRSLCTSQGSSETLGGQPALPHDEDKSQETPSAPSTNLKNEEPPTSPLKQDKSPVDSNRFGSSGNLSQASSPYSSDMEERSDSDGSHLKSTSTSRQPSLKAQPSVCENITKGGESEEKELKSAPEPSVNKDVKEQIVPAKPLEIPDRKPGKQISFLEEGPPLFAPSRLRWLKAITKVRVQLREIMRDGLLFDA